MSSTVVQPNAAFTSRIINPVLSSVVETFNTMLDCQVERRGAELREHGATLYDASTLISITGKAKGVVCLSFDRETAFGVIERFLGEIVTDMNPDVTDALGEIVNMVGGSAKSKMNLGLNMGLPNVVTGTDYCVEFPSQSKPMRVYFDSDIGPFLVDFGFVVRQL